ncbi:xanthine dehydrogenase accessory factor [Agrobacterium larrymoorei]|uniref:Xanthine dehydrogenase accessory factor n=1 Tax=Agrobacterium larrymoorei TaxID=160699 RepID=A0AAJ2ER06_9HYPH|nr:xanthine dehydrogenase accessory factor [Agrobacterium larrymoorei]
MTRSVNTNTNNHGASHWLPRDDKISALPAPQKALSTDRAYDILNFAIESTAAGRQVALCTLVEIRGGSSRPIGAHMAVSEDGRYCGYVSGGCTEAAIAAEALQAMRSGHDRFVMLGEGSPFFDIVLPCGGGITVSIHLLKTVEPLCSVNRLVDNRQCASLRYMPGPRQLSLGPEVTTTGWDDDVFVTCYRPKVRIIFSGRSLEVETTARIAEAAGYDVILLDGASSSHIDPSLIDADTAVALLQHDLDQEIPLLEAAFAASPFYIGALGSSRTHHRRVEGLRQRGHLEEAIGRIKAPIGVFAKAKDAQSLALSVIADIAASRQAHVARNESIPAKP